MRNLVITNLYPPHSIGGYEERCRQIIDRLRGRGHEVRVLTSTHGVGGETLEGHVHRRLRVHGFFGHPWLGITKLFGLEKHNHAVLMQELEDYKPDVVHVWNLGGISKNLTLALQSSGLPVVYDVSDHWIARSLKADVWLRWWNGDSGGGSAKFLRGSLNTTGLSAWIRKQAPFGPWKSIVFRRIYFCSDALKHITMEKGYPLAHAAVIYCGIDTKKFALREANERFTRLLYVGRLADDKDPLTAIRALKKLPAHFTLSLYGRGDEDYTKLLRTEAGELGARVEFKTADAAAMARVYAEHDALLFTSAWEEPFALTPLEAMAARLPVISTLEGGSRELLRHGENGLAFRTRDADDLARQVEMLAADPALRRAMAEKAQIEVSEKYDLERITTQIENFLKES
jgi:glycosyltransferase involved in cell wall biosynthesis